MTEYPVKERIVQALEAALKAIPGVQVHRPRRTGEAFAPQDRGISMLQDDEQRSSDDDLAGNPALIGWRLPISLDLVVRHSERDSRPMDQVLNLLEAEVRKAAMADPQLGGLALRTELGPSEYPSSAEGVEGVTVWVNVTYRVPENDPYWPPQ